MDKIVVDLKSALSVATDRIAELEASEYKQDFCARILAGHVFSLLEEVEIREPIHAFLDYATHDILLMLGKPKEKPDGMADLFMSMSDLDALLESDNAALVTSDPEEPSKELADKCGGACRSHRCMDCNNSNWVGPAPGLEKRKSRIERYKCWAGTGWPKGLDDLGFKSKTGIVWPIVDNEKCGPIDGFPTPEQWCAIAFDFDMQRIICDNLNRQMEPDDDDG